MEWEKDNRKQKKIVKIIQITVIAVAVVALAIYFIVSFRTRSKNAVNDLQSESQGMELQGLEEDLEDPQYEYNQDSQLQEEVDVQKWMTTMSDYEVEALRMGVDVAKWQGIVDWKTVSESGIEFAMIRIGYRTQESGEICEDTTAKYNLQEAVAAGLDVGVYFFSTAINEEEALEEAKWVCDYIEKYPITYPVAYNCEGFQNSENRQYNLTNETRTDIAIAFLDYIAGQDYTPMFYAAKNELTGNNLWDTDRLETRYKIWVARYGVAGAETASRPDYTGLYDMWQYTQNGKIAGFSGAVDVNISYFGYLKQADVKNEQTLDKVELGIADLMNFKEVNETVTAKDVTNMRSEPSTEKENTIVAQLKNGEQVKRVGMDEKTGWSKLEYNGNIVYSVSSYLTTDFSAKQQTTNTSTTSNASSKNRVVTKDEKVVVFVDIDDTVSPKMEVNLRSEPSTSAGNDTVWHVIPYGEKLHRTGIAEAQGWSRIEYDGGVFYAVTSYIYIIEPEE